MAFIKPTTTAKIICNVAEDDVLNVSRDGRRITFEIKDSLHTSDWVFASTDDARELADYLLELADEIDSGR